MAVLPNRSWLCGFGYRVFFSLQLHELPCPSPLCTDHVGMNKLSCVEWPHS